MRPPYLFAARVRRDVARHAGLSATACPCCRMSYQDFITNFSKMDICSLGPDAELEGSSKKKKRYEMTSHQGSWKKRMNAGGCLNNRSKYRHRQRLNTSKSPYSSVNSNCSRPTGSSGYRLTSHLGLGLNSVYTIQPVVEPLVQPVGQLAAACKQTSNRLSNRLCVKPD